MYYRKITNIENCFRICHSSSNYIENGIFQGLQVVRQEICENDQGNVLYSFCIQSIFTLCLSFY